MRGSLASVALFASFLTAAPFLPAAPPIAGRQAGDAGAVTDQDREHWAFHKVRRPAVPVLNGVASGREEGEPRRRSTRSCSPADGKKARLFAAGR